jgi:hypothetical protein
VLLDCALRSWVLESGLFIWDCYLTILAVFSPLAGHSAIRPSRLRRVFSAICASFSLPPGFSSPSLLHLCSPRFLPLSALSLRSRCFVCAIFVLFWLSSLYSRSRCRVSPCCDVFSFRFLRRFVFLHRLCRLHHSSFVVSSVPSLFPEWIPRHPWRNVAFISRLAPVVTFLPRSSSSRSPPLLRPCRINRCLCAVIPWSFHPFPHLFRLLASSSL